MRFTSWKGSNEKQSEETMRRTCAHGDLEQSWFCMAEFIFKSSDIRYYLPKCFFPQLDIRLNNKVSYSISLSVVTAGNINTTSLSHEKRIQQCFGGRPGQEQTVPNFPLLCSVYKRLAQHEYPPSFQSLRYVQIQQHVRLYHSLETLLNRLEIWTFGQRR